MRGPALGEIVFINYFQVGGLRETTEPRLTAKGQAAVSLVTVKVTILSSTILFSFVAVLTCHATPNKAMASSTNLNRSFTQ